MDDRSTERGLSEPRPSIWAARVELGWWVLKLPGGLLACLIGADALARVGACRFSLFEAGGLLVGLGTVLLLRPPYQLAALGVTLAAAALIGVLRTVNVVLHALVAGEGIPAVSGGYLVRAMFYGAYLVGYWYVYRVAEKALERSEG
jgi:hypothetical protein